MLGRECDDYIEEQIRMRTLLLICGMHYNRNGTIYFAIVNK